MNSIPIDVFVQHSEHAKEPLVGETVCWQSAKLMKIRNTKEAII